MPNTQSNQGLFFKRILGAVHLFGNAPSVDPLMRAYIKEHSSELSQAAFKAFNDLKIDPGVPVNQETVADLTGAMKPFIGAAYKSHQQTEKTGNVYNLNEIAAEAFKRSNLKATLENKAVAPAAAEVKAENTPLELLKAAISVRPDMKDNAAELIAPAKAALHRLGIKDNMAVPANHRESVSILCNDYLDATKTRASYRWEPVAKVLFEKNKLPEMMGVEITASADIGSLYADRYRQSIEEFRSTGDPARERSGIAFAGSTSVTMPPPSPLLSHQTAIPALPLAARQTSRA